jgi:protein TonB
MLFLTYSTLNYKTYDKSNIDIGKLNLDDELDEEIPIIEQIIPPPPPPPPPAAPEVIEVVEDEEEVEETVIESTETDQDEEIMEVEDVEVEEVIEDVEVPFAVIENVPEYPGCERGSNADKRKCMSDKIAKFVQRKFNTDLAGDLGLSGRQRISVIFKIDKNGNVTGVRSRAPHPRLEKEAARVINMLPKMKPGRQRGKPVIVPYSLPITFQVQD